MPGTGIHPKSVTARTMTSLCSDLPVLLSSENGMGYTVRKGTAADRAASVVVAGFAAQDDAADKRVTEDTSCGETELEEEHKVAQLVSDAQPVVYPPAGECSADMDLSSSTGFDLGHTRPRGFVLV